MPRCAFQRLAPMRQLWYTVLPALRTARAVFVERAAPTCAHQYHGVVWGGREARKEWLAFLCSAARLRMLLARYGEVAEGYHVEDDAFVLTPQWKHPHGRFVRKDDHAASS